MAHYYASPPSDDQPPLVFELICSPRVPLSHATPFFPQRELLQARNAAAENADPLLLLRTVLPQAFDKHPEVCAQALILVEKCLLRLGVGDVPDAGLEDGLDLKLLLQSVAKGAGCKTSDAKEAAARSAERYQ